MLAIRGAACGDRDARDARVQRQPAEIAAERDDALVVIKRAERLQQPVTLGDVTAFRRIEPGEIVDITQTERSHLQDHAGEVRAQDFRIGERRPRLEVRLIVEPKADAGADTPAAAGTLIRRSLRDVLDLQLLHAEARREAVDARRAGIDDIADARHGHRGFGNVGRQHDARRTAAGEHLVLLLRRQPRVQRQHLGTREAAGQAAGQIVDLALAGQEDQRVADPAGLPQAVDAVGDRAFEIVILLRLAVAHLDRIGAAFDQQDRRGLAACIGEVPGQLFRIERG